MTVFFMSAGIVEMSFGVLCELFFANYTVLIEVTAGFMVKFISE